MWWANLGERHPLEQTGRLPVVIWQSDLLSQALQSILVVPLTTNMQRVNLADPAIIRANEFGPPSDSVALAFQMRAKPKRLLESRIRLRSSEEVRELELATDGSHW